MSLPRLNERPKGPFKRKKMEQGSANDEFESLFDENGTGIIWGRGGEKDANWDTGSAECPFRGGGEHAAGGWTRRGPGRRGGTRGGTGVWSGPDVTVDPAYILPGGGAVFIEKGHQRVNCNRKKANEHNRIRRGLKGVYQVFQDLSYTVNRWTNG